jgi:hypothetical protein
MKCCTACRIPKPLTEFRLDNREKGLRKARCKPCENTRMRQDRETHGHKRRASDRQAYSRRRLDVAAGNKQRFYGLSELDAFRTIEAPGCEICGERNDNRLLAVDHDHATGRNRGVLCDRCNLALGHMRDNPILLRRAAEYIEQSGFGFFAGTQK